MRRSLASIPVPVLVLAVLVAGCSGSASRKADSADASTGWPEGYASWKKLNDAPIFREADQRAWNLYANPSAFGRPGESAAYPIGTVLVKEERLLEANPQGRLKVGETVRLSVMFKVGKGETSGWSFKAFDPQDRREFPPDQVDPDGCYFCHADASARDYVFTKIR